LAQMHSEPFADTGRIVLEESGLPRPLVVCPGRSSTAANCADLTTPKPITATPETPVRAVLSIMTDRRSRHMPVVDSEGHLLGLASHFDLLKASDRAGSLAELDLHIEQRMVVDVDTVFSDRCAVQAARHMLRSKRDCLPVIDGEGKVVGILTEADYLRLATRGGPACTCGGVNEGSR